MLKKYSENKIKGKGKDKSKCKRECNCLQTTLAGMYFNGIDASFLNLTRFNFSRTDIKDVNFSGSDLKGAVFTNSCIKNTDFIGSNLNGAEFTNTSLINTRFNGCNLTNVSFGGAKVSPNHVCNGEYHVVTNIINNENIILFNCGDNGWYVYGGDDLNGTVHEYLTKIGNIFNQSKPYKKLARVLEAFCV